MPFQIRPLKEFLVRPALPAAIQRLSELASNLLWSWDHSQRAVFRRLDPIVWKASNHNPIVMLGSVPQPVLERAAADPRFLALYRRACDAHDAYLAAAPNTSNGGNMLVAYFSMEYGLIDCMHIYSGGLGVLSGDHLKASSDAALPLAGVGLLYQKGYFRQSLGPDGWQYERTPVNDFYSLPMTPQTGPDGGELLVEVMLAGARVFLKVWRIDVGRVKLYLLDSNISQNEDPAHREITNQLYGGDTHTRIRQEIVLGIGGLRALQALGLTPTVYHMNEGHSAFLALERIRLLMREPGLNFEEALDAARVNNVFTTHTSVPAGIDLFHPGVMREYFADYCQESGIEFENLLALGRHDENDPNEPFSMAICAFKTSSYRNAVSRLHRRVSQQMWAGLWPKLPVWEVPITSITNGVHLPTWINGDLAVLYDQYLAPDWREGHADTATWDLINEIPDSELWEGHRRRKRRLVAFVRERAVTAALDRNASPTEVKRLQEVLDPEALTIGFARRFATYKRATLLFRDLARLKKILTNPLQKVQIVIAGKAHPLDVPGKNLIKEIVRFSRDEGLGQQVVFVEDYGIQVARELVQGVDIWLNNPRRGEEACGTSGMKAGLNGVLNLSILDGWYDEAAEESGGWVIGDREPYSPDLDDLHAAAIYSLLESEIAPLYYEGREQGVPGEWMGRVKQSLRHISANFNCQRMVDEYRAQLYEWAHRGYETAVRENFRSAREHVEWRHKVERNWARVNFIESGIGPEAAVSAGARLPLRASLDLAGLRPEDVRVEAVVGRVGVGGELEETEVLTLAPIEEHGETFVFGRDF
ncbi:MAG TPA: alpha-glucan family phosphorylase, partial [Bryobacteraceae bacterium]|nr:alpha-glucan family phosphorylase [Bryobacteraceae bacterium]